VNRITSMSEHGRRWLVALEGGIKLEAYRDEGGIPTIGPGLTFLIIGGLTRRVTMADIFATPAGAMEQFGRQLRRYEALVDANTRDDITQEEFDAFTSLAYNCEAALKGNTTVKRLFNRRAPMEQVVGALRAWRFVGGDVSPGLEERRACEADLLLKGVYRAQGGTIVP